ncbi:MAG: bifunctional methylenetetrahydrofolate dehydrogenase/methenyltetrahydrofolate cyclohydrolase FolD [Pseudomonadota bacterium]|nr:bifunctional methylenetetrahydrofolate dehydrogenase/methenyltetrahydrofolate cyclohydrolase FolD [Pseudomonadota bacterium]
MTQTKIIDGKAFAEKLRADIARRVAKLKTEKHITPGLAVVLVGDNPASDVYVKNKAKQTREAGMNSYEFRLPEDTYEATLLAKIEELNHDPNVHGILVQLPLPKQINEAAVIHAVDHKKDVDGFHVVNAGLLATGQPGFVPCTPLGCLMLLKDTLGDLSGKHAIILGRSNIVGKPMAALLLRENCTVTVAHSKTKDLPALVKQADIVVAAIGKPETVKGAWLKPGAVVIDVGINRLPSLSSSLPAGGAQGGKLVGDVDFESCKGIAAAITPVPGGVGPMTIACLLENTLKAATAS